MRTGQEGADRGWLLRRAGPLVAGRFASFVITMAIPLVLARALELEDFGTYKQIFMIGMLLSQALPMGIAQSLYYFLPRSGTPRPYLGQTMAVLTLLGALGGLAVWAAIGPLAAYMENPDLARYGWALAAYSAALVASSPLEVTLTSWGRTRLSGLAFVASDALRAAAVIVPVLLGYGLQGAMTAVVGWSVLRMIATVLVLAAAPGEGPLFDRGLLREQIAWAIPYGAAMLLALPPRYAHEFLVSSAVGPALFAIYAAGCFQVPLVNLLYTPTSEVLMVRIAELERRGRVHEAAAAFAEASGRLAYLFLPLFAFLFAAAPEFIAAVFGPKFAGAVPIFRVSVLAIVMSTLPLDGALRACNETRHLFVAYLIKALVAVPLVIVLVNAAGMMGGIVAFVVTEAVGKLLLLARIPRALRAPLSAAIPWRTLARAGVAAAGSGAVVALARGTFTSSLAGLPEGFLPRLVPLAVAGVFFAIGYAASLLAVGVRPATALRALRS